MSTTLRIASPDGRRQNVDMGSTTAKAAIAAAEGFLRAFPDGYVEVYHNGKGVFSGGKHPTIVIRLP